MRETEFDLAVALDLLYSRGLCEPCMTLRLLIQSVQCKTCLDIHSTTSLQAIQAAAFIALVKHNAHF